MFSYFFLKDMWAFGITLWELYSMGEIPYTGLSNAETSDKVIGGYRLSQPSLCPDEVYSLMTTCWKDKTSERPSAKEAFALLDDLVNLHKK